MFGRISMTKSTGSYSDNIQKLKQAIDEAETIVIGAGAGLSTSAGFIYSGERFEKYFSDFGKKYGYEDMYAGGFYPYETPEEKWAFWSRNIFVNRYMDAPKPVYDHLLELVKNKDYFVITTNVDHCFQKAGFDKERLFYTQGDYGLFQCSEPCTPVTYDNEEMVRSMILSQGWEIADNNELVLPEGRTLAMTIPSDLVPKCPNCGKPLTMNLRSDDTFVEDEGWDRAAQRYNQFLRARNGKVLFLELGVGYNTPSIIKYPFWQMTANNPDAIYACINYGEAIYPEEIQVQAIGIDGDIGQAIEDLPNYK